MKKEYVICRDCEKKIEKGESVEIDGEYVCEDCFDEHYFYCDDCGCIEKRDNGYWIDSCDRLVCRDCLDRNYFKCEDCGNYYSYNDDYYYFIHTDRYDDYYVCDSCYSRGEYSYCDGCGNYFESDMCHWRGGDCYCDNCYEEENEGLYDYHEFCDWNFYKGSQEEKVPYYIGKEIELEPKGYTKVREVIDTINNNINAVGMEDGSLECGGVEVVTHPESWEYLQEHKQNYINFFQEIQSLNYGDAGGAGLHFHVSRPNDNVVSRLIILVESFKEEIKKLSRRGGDCHWCHFLTDYYQNDKIEQAKMTSSKYLKETYVKEEHDRYNAINLQNYYTVEFRFFNGANNFEEFWGAMQFIHNLMEVALNEEKDINSITWNELIYGEELIKQAEKQGVLGIEKHAKDTTEILEKLEKNLEETKEQIKKTLKNLIVYVNKEIVDFNLKECKTKDISKIQSNTNTLLLDITQKLRYLNNIIDTYHSVNYYSMDSIKLRISDIESESYSRYFKQIKTIFNKYESEVFA